MSPLDNATGFCLQRMELYNWGTFHNTVWQINPNGHNSLLTGDIGSGKSTIVDAITTLLVPSQKITFNKAAGAQSKERSLYSYVRGAYKSEKNALTQNAKAVTLRDETEYSVLLAWFYHQGLKQGLVLAQVFWSKENQHNPERFYLICETDLTIKTHFSDFGDDINQLKKRLRQQKGVNIYTTFREYSNQFRRNFGLKSTQALDLFYQTVSMKSVGNLTDFVRQHMLETRDTASQLDALLRSFDNLNQLHNTVLKARQQIEQLEPLCQKITDYQKINTDIQSLQTTENMLTSWLAQFQRDLAQHQIKALKQQQQRIAEHIQKINQQIQNLRNKETDLHHDINDKGGQRLREIERQKASLTKDSQRVKTQYDRYQNACQWLEFDSILDEKSFYTNQQKSTAFVPILEDKQQQLQQEREKQVIELNHQRNEETLLSQEIHSLQKRKSNIPMQNLALRQKLLAALALDEKELPFVGELLQVDSSQASWEGAIERLLHQFGLSLLVPERHYKQVNQYVEQTHLKGRLVYFRIDQKKPAKITLDAGSLVEKIRIKPESEFYFWLEYTLAQRFNYHCAETLADFRLHPYAITKKGQIKAGKQRHEKDDRYEIHDRRRYVLGWRNMDKIHALETQQAKRIKTIQLLADLISQIGKKETHFLKQRDALHDLQQITHFNAIDWQTLTRSIEQLTQEYQQIKTSSHILKKLQSELEKTTQKRLKLEQQYHQILIKKGALESQLKNVEMVLQNSLLEVAEYSDEMRLQCQKELQYWYDKILKKEKLSLLNYKNNKKLIRQAIQQKISQQNKQLSHLIQTIIQKMQDFKRNYPAETNEIDAHIDAGKEYIAILNHLQNEDLPRHETTFKKMLNEQTIQGVVMFQSQLDKERRHIEDKIAAINQSLQQIEYNQGTYISLVADLAIDQEIQTFRSDLKAILSHTLTDKEDELYTESRFLHVKTIMERFRGREGYIEQDRYWTNKMIDVRNWYQFSASERWLENRQEKEFYSDSTGKSGGQKEKLAYTILASALAYQFGLQTAENKTRSFRFVVIDEAFGRGSDESTRYALALFRKLNLQLLIVTPLQKIRIIEDYIQAVHFVHNQEGKYSLLRNLSIQTYQKEKAKMT